MIERFKRITIFFSTHRVLSFSKRPTGIKILINDKMFNSYWHLMLVDEVQLINSYSMIKAILKIKSFYRVGLTANSLKQSIILKMKKRLTGPSIISQYNSIIARTNKVSKVYYYLLCIKEQYLDCVEFGKNKKKNKFHLDRLKLFVCKYLKDFFTKMTKKKIIVYNDGDLKLEYLSTMLNAPFIEGKTALKNKLETIEKFKSDTQTNLLILSKLGETSLDFPGVNVIIQFSKDNKIDFPSFQRIGRISRINPDSNNISFYFDLVGLNESLNEKKFKLALASENDALRVKKVTTKVLIRRNNKATLFFDY